jgi:diguanylate cyclase (GGDEF)-like protein
MGDWVPTLKRHHLEAAQEIDLIQEYRERVLVTFGLAAIPFLLPFSINNLIQGRFLMGILTMTFLGIQVANGLNHFVFSRRLIPIERIYLVLCLTSIFAMYDLGVVGAYWCYPVPMWLFFAARRKVANSLALSYLLIMIPASFYWFEVALASRFAITLALVTLLGHLLANLVTELQTSLVELALTDPLTGALNRLQLDHRLDVAKERVLRGYGPASIIALDIDHFKSINDTFGHDAGDQVLKGLVQLLEERIRRIDSLFRVGGEEFLILLGDIPLSGAQQLAEDIRVLVEDAQLLQERDVTVSMGVCEFESGTSVQEWLKKADDCLYQAKAEGRNRVCS